jgi:hypothetical protein
MTQWPPAIAPLRHLTQLSGIRLRFGRVTLVSAISPHGIFISASVRVLGRLALHLDEMIQPKKGQTGVAAVAPISKIMTPTIPTQRAIFRSNVFPEPTLM